MTHLIHVAAFAFFENGLRDLDSDPLQVRPVVDLLGRVAPRVEDLLPVAVERHVELEEAKTRKERDDGGKTWSLSASTCPVFFRVASSIFIPRRKAGK